MKKNVARKWIGALRSGKYKQIKNVLKRVNKNQTESFCALGVLCDLYQKEHPEDPIKEIKLDSKNKFGNKVQIGETTEILPIKVRKWAGVRNSEAYIPEARSSIPNLNDKGLSFESIADFIEKNQNKI